MRYRTLFDLTTEKINYFQGPGMIAYLLLVIGIYLMVSFLKEKQLKKVENGNRETVKELIIGSAFISMSLLFLLIFLGSQFTSIYKAKNIIKNETYRVVEGKPLNYHPMPKEGHDEERFNIEGVHFEYGDFNLKFGYKNAASLGGVIKPQNFYRITYSKEPYNNAIIKIEIKE